MDARELFLAADVALREVVDRLAPGDLDRPVPRAWSRAEAPVLRDVLAAHAYDEAWVPDVLAGRSVADGDPWRDRDLLGPDPIAGYDAVHDRATEAVAAGVAPDAVFRFQYGEYPAEEGLAHLATYRAFQAWSIAKLVGVPFHLDPALIAGLREHVLPHADEWRAWGVFPPAITPPDGADEETVLLCETGYWVP